MEVEDDDGKVSRHPITKWKISLSESVESRKRAEMARWVSHVTYHLHPSFENPERSVNEYPYILKEEGYGSFDMSVEIHFRDSKIAPFHFTHNIDLTQAQYATEHEITFNDTSQEFSNLLNGVHVAGTVAPSQVKPSLSTITQGLIPTTVTSSVNKKRPLETSCTKQTHAPPAKRTKDANGLYGYNVEEISGRLYALQGTQITDAVNIVKKYRNKNTFVRDLDEEFHFDLYTLPRDAIKELWGFTDSKLSAARRRV